MIPKFRLWDKRFSEFVEDFFVSEAGKIYKKSTDTGYGIAISRETSDKVVLMWSTGLCDKAGTEVFEGDVVHAYSEGASLIGVIEYFDNAYCIKSKNGIYNSLWTNAEYFEVIGNIYENKELLKK